MLSSRSRKEDKELRLLAGVLAFMVIASSFSAFGAQSADVSVPESCVREDAYIAAFVSHDGHANDVSFLRPRSDYPASRTVAAEGFS